MQFQVLLLVSLNQPHNMVKSCEYIQQQTQDLLLTIKYLTELASLSKDEEKPFLRGNS